MTDYNPVDAAAIERQAATALQKQRAMEKLLYVQQFALIVVSLAALGMALILRGYELPQRPAPAAAPVVCAANAETLGLVATTMWDANKQMLATINAPTATATPVPSGYMPELPACSEHVIVLREMHNLFCRQGNLANNDTLLYYCQRAFELSAIQ